MDVFLIEDNNLLRRYNTTWDKVSADIKTEFDSESVYNKNCLKTKKVSRRNKKFTKKEKVSRRNETSHGESKKKDSWRNKTSH